MKSIVLETKELTKFYKHIKVVDSINLKMEEGDIFGFLGPNGAGKTTTILMILGLTEPTSGNVEVFNFNSTREPLNVKKITSYLPENVGFYEDLTAQENLKYITRLNNIQDKKANIKIKEALEIVGILKVGNIEVKKFSHGMKQRLGIASVLIKEPKLAILDEPTSGIDPKGVEEILELIVKMNKEKNITVLISSHLLYQVQKICNKIGIISQGKLVAQGSIEKISQELIKEKKENTIEVNVSDKLSSSFIESVKKMEGVVKIKKKLSDYSLEEIYKNYFREG